MKLTKIEVKFEHPAKGMDHCSDCKHFQAPDGCKIVQGTIAKNDWCEKFEEKQMSHKKHHKISHTHIEHHGDNSHTVTHHHEDGSKHSSAHHDLDGVHDQMEAQLGAPNPGEAAAPAPGAVPGAAAPPPGAMGA